MGTTSLQGTKTAAPKCPYFGGSTVTICRHKCSKLLYSETLLFLLFWIKLWPFQRTTSLSMQEPCSVPLGIAAAKGHTETVHRLLVLGADINHQNKVMIIADPRLSLFHAQKSVLGFYYWVSVPFLPFIYCVNRYLSDTPDNVLWIYNNPMLLTSLIQNV